MEYTKEALEQVDALVRVYKEELLTIAMNLAADEDTKEIRKDHVDRAYDRLWD